MTPAELAQVFEMVAAAIRGGHFPISATPAAAPVAAPATPTRTLSAWLDVHEQQILGKGYGARIAIPLALRLDAIGMTLADVIEQCRRAGSPGDTMVRKAGGGPLEESSLSIRFAECIRAACGPAAYAADEWPSLHEVRSLSARMYHAQGVDVQTLLGHKHSEMTDLYRDDRGLSAREWKSVPVAAPEISPISS